ncbi:MAG: S66 peptidase family protein, partial [Acetobacteraceae bacterium]
GEAARSTGCRGLRTLILERGDRVAIVEPAGAAAAEDGGLLEDARLLLEEWGLCVSVPIEAHSHFYLAGTDAERAERLKAALGDRNIRGIFCARGGYGTMRLFARLDREMVSGPKLLVGYSDITALHLAASRLWPEVLSLHAPNVATRQLLGDGAAAEQNREALRRALFDANHEVDLPLEMLRPGTASGRLAGGCLSLVAATLGSAFALRTEGRILFLEDTKEAPYRIDRMLMQLRNAGILDRIGGLVFGVMHACEDGASDLRALITDVLGETSFPIGFGLAAGHGETNITLPLGGHAVLDGATSRFHVRRGG